MNQTRNVALWATLGVVAIIGIAAYIYYSHDSKVIKDVPAPAGQQGTPGKTTDQSRPVTTTKPSVTNTTTGTTATNSKAPANWKTYKSDRYGFTVRYPDTLAIVATNSAEHEVKVTMTEPILNIFIDINRNTPLDKDLSVYAKSSTVTGSSLPVSLTTWMTRIPDDFYIVGTFTRSGKNYTVWAHTGAGDLAAKTDLVKTVIAGIK